MAFIPQDEEESQEQGMNVLATSGQPQPSQPETQNQNQQVAQGAPTGGEQPQLGSQVKPQTSGQQSRGSGMFTDVRKYIKANKPATQNIAGAVTGGVQKQAQNIQKNIQQQQDKFQKGLTQSQANLQQAQQFAQEAVQKAGTGQLTGQDFQRFQKLASGETKFDKLDPVNLMQQRARAQALQGLSKRIGSAKGREELLRKTFGNKQRYTRGQQSIDSLILGADPTAAKQVTEQTKQQFGTLGDQITSARKKSLQDIYQLGEQAKGLTGREGSAAQSILGEQGARATLDTQLQEKAAQGREAYEAQRADMARRLGHRQEMSMKELSDLGVADKDLATMDTYLRDRSRERANIDFGSYLKQADPNQFNRATFASPEERARFDALSKLVGQQGLGEVYDAPKLQLDFDALQADNERIMRQNQDRYRQGYVPSGTDDGGWVQKVAPAAILCFTKDTPILMEDGSIKDIQDLRLGDITSLGGEVLTVGQSYALDTIYEYKGTYVTGSHAVFENGQWLRVKDSKQAVVTNKPEDTLVFPVLTENHLMSVNGFIAADVKETDGAWLSEQDQLKALNDNKERNKLLQEEADKLERFYNENKTISA